MAKDLELREAIQAALDDYFITRDGDVLNDRIDAYLNKGVDFRRVGEQSPFYYLRLMEDRSAGRWCEECGQHGSHHTEKHEDYPDAEGYAVLRENENDWYRRAGKRA